MAVNIEISPQDELIDVERRIVVSGLQAGQTVEITSRSERFDGSIWQAQATFMAAADGTVDPYRDAPAAGTYEGISAMGLLWSQTEIRGPDKQPRGRADVVGPVTTEIVATGAGVEVRGYLVQRYAAAGVSRREVLEDGISGTLFMPEGPGPHPAVVILNGSGGGINEPRAALYASRGYAALALGYFRAPGLPDYISNLPLEYFQKAIRWLRKTVSPLHDFVAITGQSRGGELVLLLAATFPDEVSAVMAYVPAAYVHSGQSAADPALGRESPTWTLGGRPLPHLWENNRTGTWVPYDNGASPRRHEYALLTALADHRAVERARIPVEAIKCPVLLVHGTDDGWWPTDYYCDVIEETLAAAGHPYPVKRLRYENAGHSILFPYVPTTNIVSAHAISGIVATSGGTPKANAAANEQSWRGVLDFLAEAVAARPERLESGRGDANDVKSGQDGAGLVRVRIDTAFGLVTVAVDPVRAPICASNFLAYVDGGHLAGTSIYRIVTMANQPPETKHKIEVIQWGYRYDEPAPLPPIAHEPTGVTGLRHRKWSLSMSRLAIGTAGRAFVFCMGGDLASLDESGGRNPDGHGFAAFGEVVDGFDVLERIFAQAETVERLVNRIPILKAKRL